ncbi:MAG: arylamine N-acetyltransferase [Myxococcales bacterium]|nr:arylamine N-acetyltransferase [Myxococcales bacterium]
MANPRLDLDGLSALQAAHLRALPFHNLLLLAGDGADPGLPPVEAAVEAALRGWGGTCHLLTPPFVALLRSLGFDAWLAAGSVGAPGDHLVGVVRVPEGLFVCDVGNGHPYLRPFRLDGRADSQTAYGWPFVFGPTLEDHGPSTHALRRHLPNGAWKTVYVLDPRPVDYASFAPTIRAHHTEVSYGPFLSGLRAVRMTEDVLVTLRDRHLERFHRSGRMATRRPVADDTAIARVLEKCFGLAELPWREALEALRRREPGRWASSVELVDAPLRVLVSVGVTDRPGALARIGAGLVRARARAGMPEGAIGILALDNGPRAGLVDDEIASLRAAGMPTVAVPSIVAARWHQRLHSEGLVADPPGGNPVGIATCRALQVAAIWEHLTSETGLGPLPRGPSVAVWMLDDDLEFVRLDASERGLEMHSADDVLITAASLRAAHPEASVLVGGTTGCPPVPGFTLLAAQVRDLAAHLARAAVASPDDAHLPGSRDRRNPDYYYDHSDAGAAHELAPFDWEAIDGGSQSVREALLAHLKAIAGLAWGMPATRLLVHDPGVSVAMTTARGGNALFLDADALFAAPPLALRCSDGIVTRRGDTVWAELMAEQLASLVVRAPLSLHHVRRPGDHSAPLADATASAAAMRRFVAAQARGTTLARLVAARRRGDEPKAEPLLRERNRRLRASIDVVRRSLPELRAWADAPAAWWRDDDTIVGELHAACDSVARIVDALDGPEGDDEGTWVAAELEAFAAGIPDARARWRALWR